MTITDARAAELRALTPAGRAAFLVSAGEEIDRLNRFETLTGPQASRAQDLLDAVELVEQLQQNHQETVRAAISNPANRENGFAGGHVVASRTRNPWQGLDLDVARSDSLAGLNSRAHDALEAMDESVPDAGRELLAQMLRSDMSRDAAAFVIAASDPDYVTAFGKATRSEHGYQMWNEQEQRAYQRVEAVRSTMSLTSANGGYLVPVPLDPTVVLTNSGIVNPIRSLARIETTSYATWNGVASAGTTATWTSENTALTDGSPTVSPITVTPNKLADFITGSYEIFQDSNISSQLPRLIGDAFDRAEGDAFVVGSGTPPTPIGVVTAVTADAGSRVSTTTAGSFSSASVQDLYNLDNALPARARAGKVTWLAHRATINIIRSMAASNYGSSFWANLGDSTPPQLLDHPIREASAMVSAITTGSNLILLGDFSEFLIVDRIGTTVEFVQNVVDSNGVPTGTRGWIAWKRTGSAVTNTDAFRVLKL